MIRRMRGALSSFLYVSQYDGVAIRIPFGWLLVSFLGNKQMTAWRESDEQHRIHAEAMKEFMRYLPKEIGGGGEKR